MADVFELYYQTLHQSDRDAKTIARYWSIVRSCRTWLDSRPPDISSAKEFLAYLRQRGYEPASVLLYYHGLRQFCKSSG